MDKPPVCEFLKVCFCDFYGDFLHRYGAYFTRSESKLPGYSRLVPHFVDACRPPSFNAHDLDTFRKYLDRYEILAPNEYRTPYPRRIALNIDLKHAGIECVFLHLDAANHIFTSPHHIQIIDRETKRTFSVFAIPAELPEKMVDRVYYAFDDSYVIICADGAMISDWWSEDDKAILAASEIPGGEVLGQLFSGELPPSVHTLAAHSVGPNEIINIINPYLDDPLLLGDFHIEDEDIHFYRGSEENLTQVLSLITYAITEDSDYGDDGRIVWVAEASTEYNRGCIRLMEDGNSRDSAYDKVDSTVISLLDALFEENEFAGHTWEYNDGARNRISGYTCDPSIIPISIERPSAHERLAAIVKLRKWCKDRELQLPKKIQPKN